MTFYSNFSDIDGNRYEIEITSETSGQDVNLTMGGHPCVISSSSEGLFAPIKSRAATLEIVTTEWFFDLYEPEARGTSVKIYKYDEEAEYHQGEVIFRGYLTPCSYDQDFTYLDTITLEAIDAVSTCKDFKWNNDNIYHNFHNIIIDILKDAGYQGNLYIPEAFTKINTSSIQGNILDKLYISSNNFLDDDEAKTPWTQYEVLEEIMKFTGWSLCPFGDDVYLIDYRAENAGAVTYNVYEIQTGTQLNDNQSLATKTEINLTNEAPGTANISIDDIYNKIEISDSLYNIEEIAPDIFDNKEHISVTEEKFWGNLASSKWTKTSTKTFLGFTVGDPETTVTGYVFQTICRLKDTSGWTHHYYKLDDLTEVNNDDGKGYYYYPYLNAQGGAIPLVYDGMINRYCNTHGCLLQHYAYLKNQGENNLPSSIDWNDILTFFVTGPYTPNFNVFSIDKFEKPVLEYNTGEAINWKPRTGTSWITIKGDLYYQYNDAKFGKKNKNTLNIVSDRSYTTAPVDKATDIDAKTYCLYKRSSDDADYGKGFKTWKMKLQIGDRYWDGEEWTDVESTFYINYNNNPDGESGECLDAFSWQSAVNNHDYKDKVGVDGYCIPIAYDDINAPVFGEMKLTIYTPRLIPEEMLNYIQQEWHTGYTDISWKNLPPIIYCKDFELGYVYTDDEIWWNTHEDTSDSDKTYVGYIDDNYVNEFDGITLKINTALPDKPISRSFVATSTGLLTSMKHICGDVEKTQEYNVVDEYLDHHSDRRVIYNTNIHGNFAPNVKFSKDYFNGTLMIDEYSWDVQKNNNTIKFIEF